MFTQLQAVMDPGGTGPYNNGGAVTGATMQVLGVPNRVWVATFTINYSAIPTTAFVGHGFAAGDLIIAKCADVTHALLIGNAGVVDTVW